MNIALSKGREKHSIPEHEHAVVSYIPVLDFYINATNLI